MVRYTNDEGSNWTNQNIPNSEPLFGVHFHDEKHGWVVGGQPSGVVYRTTDGGDTWQSVSGLSTPRLNDVQFFDPSRGWAVGNSGAIHYTLDSGKTWVNDRSGTAENLYGLHFPEPTHGWIVGWNGTVQHKANAITSIPEGREKPRANIDVYPNPANSRVFVESKTSSGIDEFRISLFNSKGQVLQKKVQKISPYRSSMNLKELSPGLYFLKIQGKGNNGERVEMEKLVVE